MTDQQLLYAALIVVSALAALAIGLMTWALKMVTEQTRMNFDYFKTVTALVDELKAEREHQ